ncbi:hypothetical protein Trydic_g19556 [Trypoxylus dichotomus]
MDIVCVDGYTNLMDGKLSLAVVTATDWISVASYNAFLSSQPNMYAGNLNDSLASITLPVYRTSTSFNLNAAVARRWRLGRRQRSMNRPLSQRASTRCKSTQIGESSVSVRER